MIHFEIVHISSGCIPDFATNTKELEKMQSDIQQIQADIINLPVSWGFSPNRWQTIVDAMLKSGWQTSPT
jgi:hypothetical protein